MSRTKSAPHRHGFLLLDKPEGLTSHDVVDLVRRAAGQRQVGHTGTLDPMATGLMVLLLGRATRLEPWLTKMDKVYTGQLELGLSTDSDDRTGQILDRHSGPWPGEDLIRRALADGLGEQDQIPPAFSAVKVDGRRAYKAARAGEALELKPRRVAVRSLTLIDYQPPLLDFRAEVSSGFYIRSLARDLGRNLGPGGALTRLRRESVGLWSVIEAVSPESLVAWTDEDWRAGLKPPAEALPHWPDLVLPPAELIRFGQGQKLSRPAEEPGQYKILDASGCLCGLGEIIPPPSDGGLNPPRRPFLRPLRVFPDDLSSGYQTDGKE